MSVNVFRLGRRRTADPATVAALAAAQAEQTRAEIERVRALAELRREQAAAERAAALEAERAARQAMNERAVARDKARAERNERLRIRLAKVRPVVPLLIINGGAVYAQAAYAYHEVAPVEWNEPSKLAFAMMFAAALESIAVYVQWHAHDALIQRSYATAAKLRRASWALAGVVAGINYAHFAGEHGAPTPAAVSFALLSLLSPWLWGLHTRRAQHVQLLAEDANLIDDAGAQFSLERRRAFPIRSWAARRWSIDHGVRDPREAWAGYNAERDARRAQPAGRFMAAWAALRGPRPAPAAVVDKTLDKTLAVKQPAARPARRTQPRPAGRPSKAAKVTAAAAKMPDAKPAEIAAAARVSTKTVRRHLSGKTPAAPSAEPVNGRPVPDLIDAN